MTACAMRDYYEGTLRHFKMDDFVKICDKVIPRGAWSGLSWIWRQSVTRKVVSYKGTVRECSKKAGEHGGVAIDGSTETMDEHDRLSGCMSSRECATLCINIDTWCNINEPASGDGGHFEAPSTAIVSYKVNLPAPVTDSCCLVMLSLSP